MYGLLHQTLFRHRELVWEMSLRELKGSTQGAVLGWLWVVLRPLIQTAAYVIVVSFVFRAELPDGGGYFDYAIYVLSGMVAWQILTKTLEAAPSLIRERMELVKQVIYPIETLPITGLIAGSIGSLVALAIYFVLALWSGQAVWSWVLLPIPAAVLVVFVLGTSWVFMIAGVLVKDLREIVALLLNLLVYLSPVVASESMIGARAWGFLMWNPLTHFVICFRDVFRAEFHPGSWIVSVVLALVMLLLGSWTIRRTKILINEYI
jgi:ABC-type polysaccharide/polyol phosphate export permease